MPSPSQVWPTVNGLLRDRQQLLQTFHDVYFTGNSETGQMRSLWLCQVIRGSGRDRDSQMRSLWLCQATRGRGRDRDSQMRSLWLC